MKKMNAKRAGFTLVELSIVLVIIGLIIGGVLTGRQIIENAEITNAINSVQAYQAQFQTYVQNYGALPGDDSNASTRFSTLSTTGGGNGNGNGTLEGTFDDVTSNSKAETRLVWADLRAAGLVKNQVSDASSTAQPTNPFNGIFGFQHGAFGTAMTSNVICLNNVPAAAAQAIDSRLDDGSSNSGSIQAMVSTGVAGEAVGGTVATSYVADKTYTMCVRI